MSNPFFKNRGPFKITEIINLLNLKLDIKNKDQYINDIKDLLTCEKEDITFFHSKKYELELFGEERTMAEMEEFLKFNFIKRSGGGIGVTRLIRSMKLEGLMK